MFLEHADDKLEISFPSGLMLFHTLHISIFRRQIFFCSQQECDIYLM